MLVQQRNIIALENVGHHVALRLATAKILAAPEALNAAMRLLGVDLLEVAPNMTMLPPRLGNRRWVVLFLRS
ncbi:hypothetical protein PF003_g13674 [Phytophthora fragariae]|nr:hypothetical protein PF003_g13687 [Phytophthora fragariae]KAE8902556.1 hypothetical protein PF003_g13674 [Phytophthora fragariae]